MSQLYLVSALSVCKTLFLCCLGILQIKTNLSCLCQCNTNPHENSFCACMWPSLHNPNCDFTLSAITHGQEPVSLRSLHMLRQQVCDRDIHCYSVAAAILFAWQKMYTKCMLTCRSFVYVLKVFWITRHTTKHNHTSWDYIRTDTVVLICISTQIRNGVELATGCKPWFASNDF